MEITECAELDEKIDAFSIGSILVELYIGRPLFNFQNNFPNWHK